MGAWRCLLLRLLAGDAATPSYYVGLGTTQRRICAWAGLTSFFSSFFDHFWTNLNSCGTSPVYPLSLVKSSPSIPGKSVKISEPEPTSAGLARGDEDLMFSI